MGLGLSAAAVGGFTGLLIPAAIGPNATRDLRHTVYSAAGGALVGLTAGTVAAIATNNSGEDVGEFLFAVAAADALTTGTLLTLALPGEPADLSRFLIASTLVGSALGGVAAWKLDLQSDEQLHMALLGGIGFAAGLFVGGGIVVNDATPAASQIPGIGLLGATAGLVIGGGLGAFDLKPGPGGMVYEVWAATTGAFIGAGLGGLGAAVATSNNGLALGLAGAGLGMAAGAATTVLAPEGVALDVGDLALQPLFVLFAMWHGGALAYSLPLGSDYGTPMILLTPALTSAGLVAAAPFINSSIGDVMLTAATMGTAAWLSAMTLLSISARQNVPPVAWVLGTSLAMDAGIGAGVLLANSGLPQIGWRATYVLGVAAGTTLVLALPGSLVATASNGSLAVSDVLLGASLVGVGIGLATQGLIDFRVAPDFGLGSVVPIAAPGITLMPMIAPLPMVPAVAATSARPEVPLVFGATGTF